MDLVKDILKATSSAKVLAKYGNLVQKLRTSRRFSIFKKHQMFNQLHYGATQLLDLTLTPGGLAEVLVGANPVLNTVINELKSSLLKENGKKMKGISSK